MGHLKTLTGKRTKRNNGDEYGLATVLTWSRKQLRASLKMAGPNPSRAYFWRTGEDDGYVSESERKCEIKATRRTFILWASL